jgi:uncharacterized protein (TIGR03435 family)
MRRVWTDTLFLTTFIVGTSVTLPGQQQTEQKPPAFEVASIKPNTSGDLGQHIWRTATGLTVTDMPLRDLIRFAYLPLQSFQVVGGPSWLGGDRFDMLAKIDGPAPPPTLPGADEPDAFMLSMRTLLADRFKLKLHQERRDMDVYALVLGKLAVAGLKPSTADCEAFLQEAIRHGGLTWPEPGATVCGLWQSPAQIRMGGVPLSFLTNALSGITGRIVFDRTRLTGKYELTLTWTPDGLRNFKASADLPAGTLPRINGVSFDPDGPSIFVALEQQLGLKLESTKGPVDVLVIDHVERPTPD